MYADDEIRELAAELEAEVDRLRDDFETLAAYDASAREAERTVRAKYGDSTGSVFDLDGVDTLLGHYLLCADYDTVEAVADATVRELTGIVGVTESSGEQLREAAVDRMETRASARPTATPGDVEPASVEDQIEHQRRAAAGDGPFPTGEELVRDAAPVSRDDEYPGTCGFAFDPAVWKETNGRTIDVDVERFADGVWRCPHDAPDGEQYCLFHQSPGRTDAAEVRDAFLERVGRTADSRLAKQFVGARFGDLDLDGRIVDPDDAYPIVLQHASFEGDVDLEGATFTNELRLSHSRLTGSVEAREATFEAGLQFYDCHVDATAGFAHARFGGRPLFARSEFEYGVEFDGAGFDEGASFSSVRFHSYVTFNGARFGGPATFLRTAFEYRAEFRTVTFERAAGFAAARFDLDSRRGYLPRFDDAVFRGEAIFGRHGRYENIGAAVFVHAPTFDGATFHEPATFTGCAFVDGADFRDACVRDGAAFDDAVVTGTVDWSDAELAAGIEFAPRYTGTNPRALECRGTTVATGEISQPARGRVFVDFTDATVGDVSISDETAGRSPLDSVRFVRTRFDGFDFMRYRPDVEDDWVIHTFDVADGAPADVPLDPVDEELTYLRAKSGANRIGDGRSASGFFRHEMRARRRRYRQRARDAETPSETLVARRKQWFNRLFDSVCRYGESPLVTLRSAVLVVLAYVGLYAVGFRLTGATQPYAEPDWPAAVEYGLFSTESFVALINSPAARIHEWPLRLLSASEGFLGAFFIALFLFTLTRYVHR